MDKRNDASYHRSYLTRSQDDVQSIILPRQAVCEVSSGEPMIDSDAARGGDSSPTVASVVKNENDAIHL